MTKERIWNIIWNMVMDAIILGIAVGSILIVDEAYGGAIRVVGISLILIVYASIHAFIASKRMQ